MFRAEGWLWNKPSNLSDNTEVAIAILEGMSPTRSTRKSVHGAAAASTAWKEAAASGDVLSVEQVLYHGVTSTHE